MANTLGTRPIVIDTPGAGVLRTDWTRISSIVWTDYTVETHNCVIQDKDGTVIASGNGHADMSPVEFSIFATWAKGLKVPTLDSGKILIYVD